MNRRAADRPAPLPVGSEHWKDDGFMLKTPSGWVEVVTYDFWPVAMMREHGTTRVWDVESEVAP